RLQLDVAWRVAFQQGLEYAELDVVGVEMLGADEVDVGTRQAASGRPRITPARVRHEARIRAARRIDAAGSLAVFGQMLAPARRQELVEIARRAQVGMD